MACYSVKFYVIYRLIMMYTRNAVYKFNPGWNGVDTT